MTPLLGRKYRLTFGKPGTTGKVVTGLDISFDIEKTTVFKPNTANITVYNLSKESRAALEDPDAIITLEAGYEGQFGIIFTGNDLLVQTKKNGVDFETIIRSRDGGQQISDTVVNMDIPAGEDLRDTVEKVVTKFNDVTGRNIELSALPKKKSKKAKSISKPAKDILTEILEPLEYEWSIQNGEFRVVPINEGSMETVFILSPGSGLIGSPERTRLRLPGKEKDQDGISFACLLNSQVTPLRRVQLAALNIRGIYKVTRVTYRGDLRGSSWYCEVEGIPL